MLEPQDPKQQKPQPPDSNKPQTPGSDQKTVESISELTTDEMEYRFRTNIFAQFHLAKVSLPHMEPGGTIVNAVGPGPVWTPLERITQPAVLAPNYVFLASSEASYITGIIYGATGGDAIA